jgi:plasmid maintenance system antidote protein VapI
MGITGQVTTPTEKLRDALRDRRWSEEELAWVLDLSVELAEHLLWEPHVTPTLALRLEAALEIPARDWYAAAGTPMPDLWFLQDHMAGELAAIRRRRYRLSHERGHEDGSAPCT